MKKHLRSFFLYYLPALLWAGVIFQVSAQQTLPGPESGFLDYVVKKGGHLTVYFILFILSHRALTHATDKLTGQTKSTKSPSTRTAHSWLTTALPLLICILYAFTDEYHQTFVPGRHGTLHDIGFDTLGASVAWLWKYKYV